MTDHPARDQEKGMVEMKPCPFCGKPGKLEGGPNKYRMRSEWSAGCQKAFIPHGAKGFYDCIGPVVVMRPTAEDAAAIWNTRSDLHEAAQKRIQALEGALRDIIDTDISDPFERHLVKGFARAALEGGKG